MKNFLYALFINVVTVVGFGIVLWWIAVFFSSPAHGQTGQTADAHLVQLDGLLRVGDAVTTYRILNNPCKCYGEKDSKQ